MMKVRQISYICTPNAEVAQSVEHQLPMPEGRGFESRFPLLKPLKRSVLGSKKPYVSTICKAFSFSVGELESI